MRFGRRNSVKSRNRDGVHYVGKYAYAWRGGPRVNAPQGTAAFDAEVKRLREVRTPEAQPAAGLYATIGQTVDKYLNSEDFLKRAPRTQEDYRKLAKVVVKTFGDLPGNALATTPDQFRGEILDWRDGLAKRSKRQADYAYVFFNLVLNWGKKRGKLPANPCRDQGVEKLYTTNRRDKVWTDEQMAAFRAHASPEIGLALELGFWTLQRQGDLLEPALERLRRRHHHGSSKTRPEPRSWCRWRARSRRCSTQLRVRARSCSSTKTASRGAQTASG